MKAIKEYGLKGSTDLQEMKEVFSETLLLPPASLVWMLTQPLHVNFPPPERGS